MKIIEKDWEHSHSAKLIDRVVEEFEIEELVAVPPDVDHDGYYVIKFKNTSTRIELSVEELGKLQVKS
jgi:hypothetical protein